jgi:predicted NBD/HSP70 family sugar kinase
LKNINLAVNTVWSPKVQGIGIGIAGKVDRKKGIFVKGPNFDKNFKNVNLRNYLQTAFKVPLKIENDANCFVLAEAIHGIAKNYNHVVGLTLGTGVGGGIVINKQVYHGSTGSAGELGHITIQNSGLKCSCGHRGHLEAYASGKATSNLYKKLSGRRLHPLEIEANAKKGNKKALTVFNTMSDSLAAGLSSIIYSLNPDIIVLGGGLAKVKIYISPAIKLAKKKLVYSSLNKTKIVTNPNSSNMAILGATLLFKK